MELFSEFKITEPITVQNLLYEYLYNLCIVKLVLLASLEHNIKEPFACHLLLYYHCSFSICKCEIFQYFERDSCLLVFDPSLCKSGAGHGWTSHETLRPSPPIYHAHSMI